MSDEFDTNADGVDFALVAYREEGVWQLEELAPEAAGDLSIVADLGMGAMDMGALLDDVELYPDEMLADIATRLGFGTLYDQVLGVATQ